jgi:hypothetical protein
MKWVLIVMTFWRPDVQIKTNEVYFSTEEDCMTAMHELERRYVQHKNDGFGYVLTCRQEEPEDE